MNTTSIKLQKVVASKKGYFAITTEQYHQAEPHRIIDVKSSDLVKLYSLGDDARDAILCVLPMEGGFIAWRHDKGFSMKVINASPRRCLKCIMGGYLIDGRLATIADYIPSAVEDIALSRITAAMVGSMFHDLVVGKTVFCDLSILESMQYGLKFFRRFKQFPRFFAIDTEVLKKSKVDQ